MSHIRCPMCGKDCALSGFNPASLDDDIYVRQTHGRGRGTGFSFDPDESILGDEEYSPMICMRCLVILRLMIENKVITEKEVLRELKLGVPSIDGYKIIPYDEAMDAARNTINDCHKEINNLKSDNITLISINKNLRSKFDRLREEKHGEKKIDSVLISLSNVTECEIIQNKDNWILSIKNIDDEGLKFFCRELYRLTVRERMSVKERINTDNRIIQLLFDFFRGEPTIRSVTDRLTQKPNLLYDLVHLKNSSVKIKDYLINYFLYRSY